MMGYVLPMFRNTPRRLAAIAMVGLAAGLAGCGGDDDTASEGQPPAASETQAPAAAAIDKVTDTAATAKAASATKVPADELEGQIAAVEQGLKDGGFDPSNVGEVGDAKADFEVDTSWAVYVYDSDRSAAEFALSLKDIRPESDAPNYELFRVGNRVYYASMTSALSDDDKAKLDTMAKAVEGAIAG